MLGRGIEPENSHNNYRIVTWYLSPDLSQVGGEVPLEVGSLCSLSDDGHYLVPAGWLDQPVIHRMVIIIKDFCNKTFLL